VKTYPQQINVQTSNAEQVIRALRSCTADFGVAAIPIDHAGMGRHVVCEPRLLGVVATTSPQAQSLTPLPLSVFAHQRLITAGNTFRIRHTIDQTLQNLGIRPPSEFATNASLNATMAARSGLGIALVDPVTAYGVRIEGMKVVELHIRGQCCNGCGCD